MVRADFFVGTFSTTVYLSGESSWMTVRLPSPQEAIAEVQRETGRRFARRERPAVVAVEVMRIEMMELGGVLVVHIDRALAVSDGEFGPAAQSYRADNRAIRGVDRGGVFAAAVEGEDALADGIVDDGVGIRVCFDGAEGLQRLEIEDGYIVRTAVAGEAAAEIGSDGDSMDALGVGDVANNGVGVRIENDDVRAARDVDAAGVTINENVIPAAVAADRDGLDDVIAAGAGRRSGGARECYRRKDRCHCE